MRSRRISSSLVFIQLGSLLLCSVAKSVANNQQAEMQDIFHYRNRELHAFTPNSTPQKDITTPITTFPTNPTNPYTRNPVFSPTVSNPDSAAATNTTNPLTTPATTASPGSSSASWCVASQSSSKIDLQVALDYACGYGGTDCSAIQPGGSCYMPNTVHDHASYAFNSYYQKNPTPTSCSFGGNAVTTSTNPSYGTCQYPATSTSSSILNTTNSSGARVYGAGPITPSASVASIPSITLHFQVFVLTLILERICIDLTIAMKL